MVNPSPSFRYGNRTHLFTTFYVRNGWQQKGIGKQLLDALGPSTAQAVEAEVRACK